MKNIYYILLLTLFIIGCQNSTPSQKNVTESTPTPPAENTLTEEEKAAGWELLFDGISTDKWRGYNNEAFPTLGWRVEDGTIKVEKSGTRTTRSRSSNERELPKCCPQSLPNSPRISWLA